jgi:sec-independent protein translocase protein TatA
MGSLGMPEILVILVIALIIFGPRKLPELGKSLGKSLAQFRRASEDFKRQWEDEVAIERQRIEAPAPAPAPVDHASYSAADSTAAEEIQTSASEEPLHLPTAGEAPAAAHHEETAAHETKRDWM